MNIGKWLPMLGVLAALNPVNAAIIKVYSPLGSQDFDGMQRAANELEERILKSLDEVETASDHGTIDGFSYRIVPGTLATHDLSMTPGSSAFFLATASYRFQPGFSFSGGKAVFRANTAKKAPEALAKDALELVVKEVHPTALSSATVTDGQLMLRYSLEKPATVSIRIVDPTGKLIGKWSWRNGASGPYTKAINTRLAHGIYLLEWSAGQHRMTRRLMLENSQ